MDKSAKPSEHSGVEILAWWFAPERLVMHTKLLRPDINIWAVARMLTPSHEHRAKEKHKTRFFNSLRRRAIG